MTSAKAQTQENADAFLDRFEAFVVNVENNDSIADWDPLNTEYKRFREECSAKYKSDFSNSQSQRYEKIKTRYIKLVATKRVGKKIEEKANDIKNVVVGAFEGIFK